MFPWQYSWNLLVHITSGCFLTFVCLLCTAIKHPFFLDKLELCEFVILLAGLQILLCRAHSVF